MALETLPYAWYSSAEVLGLERRRIFARSWQYAGRVDEVAAPGSLLPVDAGGIPILVARGADATLRAFLNVCRHRGSILVEQSGRRETIQCPYHAWTYELDGRLRAAPRGDELGECELGLRDAAVDAWGPFLFVNADADAPPLADVFGDVPAQVADAGIDVDALRFHHRAEWSVAANWKVVAANILECFNCAVAQW